MMPIVLWRDGGHPGIALRDVSSLKLSELVVVAVLQYVYSQTTDDIALPKLA
jgi:hypothetical protein